MKLYWTWRRNIFYLLFNYAFTVFLLTCIIRQGLEFWHLFSENDLRHFSSPVYKHNPQATSSLNIRRYSMSARLFYIEKEQKNHKKKLIKTKLCYVVVPGPVRRSTGTAAAGWRTAASRRWCRGPEQPPRITRSPIRRCACNNPVMDPLRLHMLGKP